MKTSDPKAAESMITDQCAIMNRLLKAAQREADLPPDTHAARLDRDQDQTADKARADLLTARNRHLKTTASDLGEQVPPAPIGVEEGAIGIRELSVSFMDAHNYEIQNRQSVQNAIRRWIESHGDIPIEKWTRKHLDTFDTVRRKRPSSGLVILRFLTIGADHFSGGGSGSRNGRTSQ